jgi:cytochrome c-type biogenesis protein CcmE
MIDDGLQLVADAAQAQVRIDVVAAWALAGVIAAGILFARLRGRHLAAKIGMSLLALGAAAALLLGAWEERPRQYYKYVDEVAANAEMFRAKGLRLQVHGCVVPGSIERRLGTDEYRFRLRSISRRPAAELRVRYTGLVPDTFRSGAEIIASGRLVGDGGLDVVPDGIMARCPSKYEADPDDGWRCAEPRP